MTPETQTKKAVRNYLRLCNWFVFHVLQGLGAHKGITDFVAIKNGNVLFIEVKAPRGKQSDFQKEFEKNITEKNGHYVLAYSVEDIEKYIVKHFGEQSLLVF